jgi:hypothetical protein
MAEGTAKMTTPVNGSRRRPSATLWTLDRAE